MIKKLSSLLLGLFILMGCTHPEPEAISPVNLDYSSPTVGVLKYVPSGSFQRNSGVDNISVITQSFRMSRYEITRTQFQAIMGTDPSSTLSSSGLSSPVQRTNWYHAITFCNKLSLAEGFTPVYSVLLSGTPVDWSTLTFADIPIVNNAEWNSATATWTNNGYRLPTEMEWMWAAMGAPSDGQGVGINTSGYAKAFSGSSGTNNLGDYGVFGFGSGQAGATTTANSNSVGTKAANELGIHDMSGNVAEICWDWSSANYPPGTQTDYQGPGTGTNRVVRGGSYYNGYTYCTVAYRSAFPLYGQDGAIGFRVVLN